MREKRALITNGNCPAGLACAEALRQDGYRIAAGSDPAEPLVACDVPFVLDREKDGGAEPAVAGAIESLGGLDLLVCTFPEEPFALLSDTTPEEIDRFYHRLYRSTLMTIKTAALEMTSKHSGTVVLVTSNKGLYAHQNDFLAGSFFAGLHRTMRSFALQLAPHQVRINAVAAGEMEGGVDSALGARLPLGRLGRWDEAAQVMLFLASEKASYLTGVTVPCDGGYGLAGMPETAQSYGWNPNQQFHLPDEKGDH